MEAASAANYSVEQLVSQAIENYKLKQQRGLLNALFISFIVFFIISLILAFVFLLIPIPGLAVGFIVLQIFWFPLLAAILFILAQALILPAVGRFNLFVGFFIIFVIFFLVSFGLGIAGIVTLNPVIGIFFVVFQFLWHIFLLVLLGLILFSLPVFLRVAVGFYSLLVIFLILYDIVFILTVSGVIGLIGGVVTLIFFYIVIIASLFIVLIALIQQTNDAKEKKLQ